MNEHLNNAGDHHEVCRVAMQRLRERFDAVVVSIGFATFASGQLCVLTDATVEDDEIPSFVHFPLDTRMLLVDALGSSDVRVLDADDYTARYPTVASLVRRPEVHTLIAVGFSRFGMHGAVSLGLPTAPGRRTVPDLQSFVGVLGDALASCERRRRERATAAALRRRFLPTDQTTSPHVTCRSLHVPARPDDQLGADWYDVFDLDDGRVAAVVGDVPGRGTDAVIAMSHASSALRTLLVVEGVPSIALARLDRVASVTRPILGTACAVAVLDPANGDVEMCRAGAPSPQLRTSSGWQAVAGGGGPPIGFAVDHRHDTKFSLADGATMLVHSDGLLRPSTTSAFTSSEVSEMLDASSADSPSLVVADLLERALGGLDPVDDVVVVALRRGSRPSSFSRTARALPPEITRVRHELRSWLERERVGDAGAAVQLAVSELMSNVVEHAYRSETDGVMIVDAEVTDDAVHVAVIDDGAWSDQIVDSVRGRGLSVVEQLAAETAVRSSSQGTIVRVSIPRR